MNEEGLEVPVVPYYVAKRILSQLTKGKNKVLSKSKQDRVYVVDGREGVGKSLLARQLAYAQDPTLSLDRIVFTSKDFEEAIRNAKRGQAVIFDECFKGMSSKASLSKENKRLVELLMECRMKCLFIYLVLPTFFMLEKYPSIFRSHSLFHVAASKKNWKIRYYKVYNYQKKAQLYLKGKSLMSYDSPKVGLKHKFYNKEIPTIDRDEYEKKKDDAFHNKPIGKSDPLAEKHTAEKVFLSKMLKEKFGCTYEDQARYLQSFGINTTSAAFRKSIQRLNADLKIIQKNNFGKDLDL